MDSKLNTPQAVANTQPMSQPREPADFTRTLEDAFQMSTKETNRLYENAVDITDTCSGLGFCGFFYTATLDNFQSAPRPLVVVAAAESVASAGSVAPDDSASLYWTPRFKTMSTRMDSTPEQNHSKTIDPSQQQLTTESVSRILKIGGEKVRNLREEKYKLPAMYLSRWVTDEEREELTKKLEQEKKDDEEENWKRLQEVRHALEACILNWLEHIEDA